MLDRGLHYAGAAMTGVTQDDTLAGEVASAGTKRSLCCTSQIRCRTARRAG